MRWIFPQDRLVYSFFPSSPMYPVAAGTQLLVYLDEACTILADIQDIDGNTIIGSVLHIGTDTLVPIFLGPDTTGGEEVRSLWCRPPGSTHTYRLDASLADRVDRIEEGQAIDPLDLVTEEQLADNLADYQLAAGLGQSGGYASLGDDGKVPSAQLPAIPPAGVQTVNDKSGPDVHLIGSDIPGAVQDLTPYATTAALTSGLAGKANTSVLSGYATTSALSTGLATKADIEALNSYATRTSLQDYATTDDLTAGLAAKADATALDAYATTEALSEGLAAKADTSALSAYATTQALSTGLAGKLNNGALTGYATTADLTAGLAGKANASALNSYQLLSAKGQINGYAALGADGKVPSAQLPAGQDLSSYQLLTGRNAANGYAGLNASSKLSTSQIPDLSSTYVTPGTLAPVATSGTYASLTGKPTIPASYAELTGTVPTSALPALAITDVFVVDTEAEMLALTAQRGDVAKRIDTSQSFILTTDNPAQLQNWVTLGGATGGDGAVTSVNSQVGDVVVNYANLPGKPTLATVATSGAYADLSGKPTLFSGVYDDLTDAPVLAPVATSGSYADLSAKPTISAVGISGAYTDLTGKPSLATVATSGAYGDLTSTPNLALYQLLTGKNAANGYAGLDASSKLSAAQVPDLSGSYATASALTTLSGSLKTVATSGVYSDLTGKPSIPTVGAAGSGAGNALSANDPTTSNSRPPTAHVHAAADITSGTLNTAQIPDLSSSYQSVGGKNAANGYPGLNVSSKISTAQIPDLSGTYATASALTSGLATKANTVHQHAASDVSSGVLAAARIPDLSTLYAATADLATVATSGLFEDLTDFPTLALVDNSTTPQALGAATAGVSSDASPADHVHPVPLIGDIGGFDLSGATDGAGLIYDGASGNVVARAGGGGVADDLAIGEQTIPRWAVVSDFCDPASGDMALSYFTAQRSATIGHVGFWSGSAGATGLTLCRAGLYSVNPSTGALTLIASTASSTTAFNGAYVGWQPALTTPVAITKGSRYAVGLLQVGTTPAKLMGSWANSIWLGQTPKLCGRSTGNANLPSTATDGSVSGFKAVYAYLYA